MKKIVLMLLFAFSTSFAYAGIANTKHNLGSTAGNPGTNKTTGTAEICVFCHTPHGADTSAPVPLWNKKLPSGAGYTTYASMNSQSIDGEILAVGSVSLACLSCHDGAQAMDNILNAPGSGGYDSTGGGATGRGWTWSGGVTDGKLNTGITNLGTDLQNDHPIGIEYCGGGVQGNGSGGITGTCKDADFKAPVAKLVNGQTVFYVDVNSNSTREKTDIALFSRVFAGSVTRPSVECASCHDPHVEQKSASEVHFMRQPTAGSAICLACHVK